MDEEDGEEIEDFMPLPFMVRIEDAIERHLFIELRVKVKPKTYRPHGNEFGGSSLFIYNFISYYNAEVTEFCISCTRVFRNVEAN